MCVRAWHRLLDLLVTPVHQQEPATPFSSSGHDVMRSILLSSSPCRCGRSNAVRQARRRRAGDGGILEFNVSIAPPAFDIQLTLDEQARIGSHLGMAIVSGTVTCNNDGYVAVYGTLRQRQGLNVARGDFYIETACVRAPRRPGQPRSTRVRGSSSPRTQRCQPPPRAAMCSPADDDTARRTVKVVRRK